MRILNYNITEDFHNTSSSAYEEFSRLLLTEVMLEYLWVTFFFFNLDFINVIDDFMLG